MASLFDVLLQTQGVLFYRFKDNKTIKKSKTFIPYSQLINRDSDDDNVMIIGSHDKKGNVLQTINDWSIGLSIENFTKITRSPSEMSKFLEKHRKVEESDDDEEMTEAE